MADRQRKGIHGWLRVFLALLILIALINLTQLIADRRQLAGAAMSVPFALRFWVHGLAGISIPLLIVWRMRVPHWSSIRFAIAGLSLLCFAVPAIPFAYSVWLGSGNVGSQLPSLLWTLLRNSWFALGAIGYLLNSRRVANTYPRADSPEALAETFE